MLDMYHCHLHCYQEFHKLLPPQMYGDIRRTSALIQTKAQQISSPLTCPDSRSLGECRRAHWTSRYTYPWAVSQDLVPCGPGISWAINVIFIHSKGFSFFFKVYFELLLLFLGEYIFLRFLLLLLFVCFVQKVFQPLFEHFEAFCTFNFP